MHLLKIGLVLLKVVKQELSKVAAKPERVDVES